jgi:hypothetical protein
MATALGFHEIFAALGEFLLLTLPIGAALLLPSLWLLFKVFKSEPIQREQP